MCRINPGDVKGGIGFRIASLLSLRQHHVKWLASLRHAGENVVGSPIDDAIETEQPIRSQTLRQRPQNRYSAADASLKADIHPRPRSGLIEFFSMYRQQGLIGGYHMLALAHGFEQKALRRIIPSDQLDHDVDLGIIKNLSRVGRQEIARKRDSAIGGDIEIGDLSQFKGNAETATDSRGVVREDLGNPAADGAKADQSNCNMVLHGSL